jgi:hypothetical protein
MRMGNETSAYLSLRTLWAGLPPTIRTNMDHAPIGDPALKKIIEIAGLWEGDFGGASGRLRMLLSAGALKARKCPDGWVELTKSEFPVPETPQEAVDKTNARIRQVVAADEARIAHELETAAQHRAFLNAPAERAKRADFEFLMKENGLDREALAGAIEAGVFKALQATGLLETVNAGVCPQEEAWND